MSSIGISSVILWMRSGQMQVRLHVPQMFIPGLFTLGLACLYAALVRCRGYTILTTEVPGPGK